MAVERGSMKVLSNEYNRNREEQMSNYRIEIEVLLYKIIHHALLLYSSTFQGPFVLVE